MPSEVMDQRRRLSSFGLASPASSFFSDELHFPTGRQVGFWRPESVPDHFGMDGMPLVSGSKSVSSSPLENLCQGGVNSVESLELPQHYMFKDQSLNFGQEHQLMGSGKDGSLSTTSWRATEQDFGLRSDCGAQHASLSMEGNKIDMNGIRYENGLFSSSLSELFNRKLTMASNIAPIGQSVDVVDSNFDDDEPLESLAELEAQTIGNLLPDDDDLLSGVVDDIGYIARPTSGDEMDDDIFYTGGGMELEGDDNANFNRTSDFLGEETPNGQQGGLNSVFAGEHPYGEHPSRTLFVRNINSNVEDSELRDLFAEYGEIRTLYTACKHRGFVMISYYDIRSARNAMRGLQNKPLRRRKLDIHFSIPKDNPTEKDVNQGTLVVFNLDSSVSNDHLRELFGAYGEIKEIRETPHKRHHKFIEFYDVRSAEAALRALNRSDLGGKKIKLEPSRPGGARRCLMQQLSPELEGEQEESNGCRQGSPPNNLSPGYGSIPLGTLSSNGFDSEVVQGLHSAVRPLPFLETAYNSISSSGPHSLSSPIRVTSAGNHPESSHSLGQMKFGFQGLPNFHPQSLPEYHDGLTNGMSYNSSSNISAMAINMNSRPAEALEGRFIQKVGSGSLGSHSFEHNKAFGVPGNGICPHGHHYIWNNANVYPHHHPGPMLWSNAPSFVNHAHPPPQMPGIPRAPSHMLNAVLPLHPHHVGSAPAVNPSLWDRRQPYGGDLTDSPAFHPGSLGSMGFPGSSPMHQLELASHSIFAHTRGGNCIDPSISSSHVGIASPQQRCHMFHGRNPMIPLPSSFDAPTDRVRSRRGDAAVNQADSKKQYELDIERIMRGEDLRTTLMIKNIPNKYTSKMLLAAIDENHRGTYDFIYLPIDFKNKCNVGYAFINMIDPQQIIPFFQAFNGKKWEKFNSEKVASLAYARIQGKQALIAHFQNSSLMNEDKRCRPILFHSDGPNAGDQEPFPMGVNIRSRPGRSRTAGYDENNQGSPSTSPSGAGCSSRADSGSTKGSE